MATTSYTTINLKPPCFHIPAKTVFHRFLWWYWYTYECELCFEKIPTKAVKFIEDMREAR